MVFNRTACAITWSAMIPTLKPRLPTSLASLCSRRPTPWCFAWTRRLRSKPWIAWIRCCLFRPAGPNRTGLSTFGTGPLSLYAALETHSGEVLGKTAQRHTSAEFVAFLGEIVATQAADKAIHIIADNLSAHQTKLVEAFLAAHTNVRIHDTPTYTSWLNQVENWFSKIQRQVIARGVLSSLTDLRRKLLRYIRHYNRTATPIRWIYSNPKRRIRS